MSGEEGKAKSVLVVDPNESVRRVVGLAARPLVGRVVEAGTAREAAEALAEGVDVAVTEVHLPDGSGIEIVRQVLEARRDSVVLVMTAEDDVAQAVELIRAGAFSVLTKPLTHRETVAGLKRALEQHEVLVQSRSAQELEVQVRQQTALIGSLLQFSNDLNALDTMQQAVELVVGTFRRMLGCGRISVLLKTQETGQFAIVQALGLPRDVSRRALDLADSPVVRHVLETGRLLHVEEGSGGEFLTGRAPGSSFVSVPLVMVRGAERDVFGVINLTDRNEERAFGGEELRLIQSVADAASVAYSNLRTRQQLETSYFDTVGALALALEAKDPYTHGHSQRVTSMCMVVADVMGFTNEQMDQIMFAGMLHDVGKIGIPESILCKPERLTPDEFQRVREHPVVGERMVGHISFLSEASKIIRQHHERWDGNGYPDRLRGEDIALPARIMAIADSFDAMTTDRSYRKKLPHHQVFDELWKGRGTQFDPECLDVFIKHVAESKSIPNPVQT